jgi:hypothetical protein
MFEIELARKELARGALGKGNSFIASSVDEQPPAPAVAVISWCILLHLDVCLSVMLLVSGVLLTGFDHWFNDGDVLVALFHLFF